MASSSNPNAGTNESTDPTSSKKSFQPNPTPIQRSVSEQAPCPHCEGSGVCKNGKNNTACRDCVDRISARIWQRFKVRTSTDNNSEQGCWCGVCLGKGRIEGATFKVLKYFPFVFTLLFVGCCFSIFWRIGQDDKLQTALTTIMGTIVGFYFGGRKSEG
jgi:hypothetical protein